MANDLILTHKDIQQGTGITITHGSDGTLEICASGVQPQSGSKPKQLLYKDPWPNSLHLVVYHTTSDGLSNGTKLIDTVNNVTDRNKIKIYTGVEWVVFPPTGAGTNFDSRPLIIDMTSVDPGYLLYWWHDGVDTVTFTGNASDRYSTYYPVSM